MKNLRFFAAAMATFALLSVSNAQPQPKEHCNWQDRMMSEKIAFLTAELALTPEEAQVFWPVYNQIAKQKQDSQKEVKAAYHALLEALNSDSSSEKEIDKLLDNYLAAKQANKELGKDDVARYRKVLSGKKVAKLYVAEENFRRNHIRTMKGHGPKVQEKAKPGPRK